MSTNQTAGSDFANAAQADHIKIRHAVIPVGGWGSRMFPLTHSNPKNLLPVGERTLIDYAVEDAIRAGCEKVHIICSPRDAEKYSDHFFPQEGVLNILNKPGKEELLARSQNVMQHGHKINVIIQSEAKGLGHAVLMARGVVGDNPFAVLLPDDLMLNGLVPDTIETMAREYKGGIAIAAIQVAQADSKKYGMFVLNDKAAGGGNVYEATGIVEKPAPENTPSNLAAMGRYILPSAIWPILEQERPGAGGEIQLTDAIDELCKNGMALRGIKVPAQRFDCGDPKGYVDAQYEVTRMIREGRSVKPPVPELAVK